MGCGASKALPANARPVDPPLRPIGARRSVRASEVSGAGPMHIGRAPLPLQMRGLFWVQSQGDASCLASMGGPSNDGGGCNPGTMRKSYCVRVSGDRTWAFADKDSTIGTAEKLDLVYVFEWNDETNPTFAHIFPRLDKIGGLELPSWLFDFDIELVPDGVEAYPGSVVWQRVTTVLGGAVDVKPEPGESNSGTYKLVQVIDGDGARIEPAFSLFVAAMEAEEAGDEPGVVWYHEIEADLPLAKKPIAADTSAKAPPVDESSSAPPPQLHGILIERADNLKSADMTSKSDPYLILRLGALGSAWADKSPESERCTDTVYDTASPVWHFPFSCAPPAGEEWEVHMRVYDRDILTADDFLGECIVALSALATHDNELSAYPLAGGVPGTITMMSGTRVEATMLEDVSTELLATSSANLGEALGTSLVDTLMAPLGRLTSAVHQWFSFSKDFFGWVGYQRTMFRLHLCSRTAPRAEGDAVTEFFTRESNAQLEWAGPFPRHCVAYNSYADVTSQLSTLGARLGSTSTDGVLERENMLGNLYLNGAMWPELAWQSIGLGAPVEEHGWARPLLVTLMGPGCLRRLGGEAWLEAKARHFFAGRRRLRLPQDIRAYVCQVQHEVLLGIQLTDAEAADFGWVQSQMLAPMVLPESALGNGTVRSLLAVDKVLAEKTKWLARYEAALRALLPEETASLGDARVAILASFVFDATVLAGGLSVPTVIQYALTLPWSEWGHGNLPPGFSLDNPSDIPAYVLEIIRLFAPVKFFPFKEKPTSDSEARRVFCNIQMAARDPAVWGADATAFKLRPLAQYHKLAVNFAEPALAPNLSSAGSRMCPGKDFGLQSIFAFLRAFARVAAPYGGVDSLWVARRPMAYGAGEDPHETSAAELAMPPSELTLNYNGSAAFELHWLESAVAGEAAARSGEALFEGLSEAERATLDEVAKSRRLNKLFSAVNMHTKVWYNIVFLVVDPSLIGDASNVTTRFLPKGVPEEGDLHDCGFAGLKLLIKDEDLPSTHAAELKRHLANAFTAKALDYGGDAPEAAEKLVYWGDADGKATTDASRAEAYAAIDAVLGKYLPAQFSTWDDLHTDGGFAALCVLGVGAWYLSAARTAETSGHATPEGAVMELNIEYLSAYETREPWITYGATAYLGAPPADGSIPECLGVWSCHLKALVVPGEPLWEHAKATFKCALGTSLTLKDHLAHLHWVAANGMCTATRLALSADHPLRRLLKQHYFATCSINNASTASLMPVQSLAQRTFGLTGEAWMRALEDVIGLWEYQPFPDKVASRGLPAEFVHQWPFAADGLEYWHATAAYVRSVLTAFFPDDAAVQADEELAAFWASFEGGVTSPSWKLPPLSLDALVTLTTELIFSVTATRAPPPIQLGTTDELVGSIVEYLLSPAGLPGKLVEGAVEADVQSHAQSLIIIALTGCRQPPLMDDWAHLFHVAAWSDAGQQQPVLDAVRERQVALEALARAVDERNAARERKTGHRFVAFNPRLMETSVSI